MHARDNRMRHHGARLMKGEEGNLNNERSMAKCTGAMPHKYPLSSTQSFSVATMVSQACRPQVSHRALSLTGSTTTFHSGPANGMPSTMFVGEAGNLAFVHNFRSLYSQLLQSCAPGLGDSTIV